MPKNLKPILVTAGIALAVMFLVFRVAPASVRNAILGIKTS